MEFSVRFVENQAFRNRSGILLYSSHPHSYGRGVTVNFVTSEGLYRKQSASGYDEFLAPRHERCSVWRGAERALVCENEERVIWGGK
jgi:hypothetical protein